MRRLRFVVGLALLSIVTWCGHTVIQAQAGRQRLDFPGVNELRLVSNNNVTVLVAQGGRSDNVAVYRSVNGSPFVPSAFVVPTNVLERRVYGIWATTHGFFIYQHNGRPRLPVLSRSDDGDRWEVIQSQAFDRPADIYGMVQLASGDLLAVGVRVVGFADFYPAMWRSRDGLGWERVELQGLLAEANSFNSIATQGTTTIVTGIRARKPALWRSDDGANSWALVDDDAPGEVAVTAIGNRFVRLVMPTPFESDLAFATSRDGVVWQADVASGLIDNGLWLWPRQVVTTTSGVFLVAHSQLDFMITKRLDMCYVSREVCTQGNGSLVVLHNALGDTWRAIDVDRLLGPGFRAFAITNTGAGAVIAGGIGDRIEILTVAPMSWSYTTPRPTPPMPQLPPLATTGGAIEVGMVYRQPLRVHCAPTWLGPLNGRMWKLERQLVTSWGSLPQIQETLLGTIRLTTSGTIEYMMEGVGVVAVYGPTDERPTTICI